MCDSSGSGITINSAKDKGGLFTHFAVNTAWWTISQRFDVRHSFRMSSWCLREAVLVAVFQMQHRVVRMLRLISGTTGGVDVGNIPVCTG